MFISEKKEPVLILYGFLRFSVYFPALLFSIMGYLPFFNTQSVLFFSLALISSVNACVAFDIIIANKKEESDIQKQLLLFRSFILSALVILSGYVSCFLISGYNYAGHEISIRYFQAFSIMFYILLVFSLFIDFAILEPFKATEIVCLICLSRI